MHLPEPKLQFAQYFDHEDTKTGLAEFGPFGRNVPGLHPSEVKLAFIGTRETIAGAKEWVEECGSPIESQNVKVVRDAADAGGLFSASDDQRQLNRRLEKILNRDFVGFSRESTFACGFQVNERWERPIQQRYIDDAIGLSDPEERIWQLVRLIEEQLESLVASPAPHVAIIALTPEIFEKAHSVQISGNFHLNFRRALKARAMRHGIPIQLLKRSTVTGKGELQEKATRAWNFCTAQYYKADGVPWRPVSLEKDVCFIGISFYVSADINDKLSMRSSVAQAFDHLGQGLILRGDPFEWNSDQPGKSPHLPTNAARALVRQTLEEYTRVNRVPPKRVVIHKTSEFWGAEHSEHNEAEGFRAGIDDVYRCAVDLVALRQTGLHLFREGGYPPLRGTHVSFDEQKHFLFTMGFVPYLDTYPGSYVPEPWEIVDHHGDSSKKELLREILALTKMNVNNCAFADGRPITLSFSEKIGEILKHVLPNDPVLPNYKFYM